MAQHYRQAHLVLPFLCPYQQQAQRLFQDEGRGRGRQELSRSEAEAYSTGFEREVALWHLKELRGIAKGRLIPRDLEPLQPGRPQWAQLT